MSLEFEKAVAELFAPVVAEMGLKVVASTPRDVRFESPLVWAHAFIETDSEALGFRFGERDRSDRFDLTDLSEAGPAAGHDPIVRTSAEVREAVASLAANIARCGGVALRGEPEAFAAMREARELEMRRYGDWTRRAAEMDLAGAVRSGDWTRVVAIYGTAEHEFDPVAAWDRDVARQNVRTIRLAPPEVRDDPTVLQDLRDAYEAFDYADTERQTLERAVGEAIDAEEWLRVVAYYQTAPGVLDRLQQIRLDIARRQAESTNGR
jgi:hypothetical protein